MTSAHHIRQDTGRPSGLAVGSCLLPRFRGVTAFGEQMVNIAPPQKAACPPPPFTVPPATALAAAAQQWYHAEPARRCRYSDCRFVSSFCTPRRLPLLR